MKKILLDRGVSSFLYILFFVFGIPLLMCSGHFSQTLSEILRQGHYTIIIYYSTNGTKYFEKWPWRSSLCGTYADGRTVNLIKKSSCAGNFSSLLFISHNCKRASVQKHFFQNVHFLDHLLVSTLILQ